MTVEATDILAKGFVAMLAEKDELIKSLRMRCDELIAEAHELRQALYLSESQKALLMPEMDEEEDPCRPASRVVSNPGTLFHTRRRFPK